MVAYAINLSLWDTIRYLVFSSEQKSKTCYTEEQVISFYKIFVEFEGTLFQHMVNISIGTNCVPFLAGLFLFSYESEFLQTLIKKKDQRSQII